MPLSWLIIGQIPIDSLLLLILKYDKMKRNDFLRYSAFLAITPLAIGCGNEGKRSVEKPNIIFIMTDQQSASMMSCTGNTWLTTPAMDYIAQNGVRFTRAYTTNPVSSPSRVSLMTGRFAGSFKDDQGLQVRENDGSMRIPEISDEVRQTTIAAFLKKAGYELIFGGKQHLPKALAADSLGFRVITYNERDSLADKAAMEIKARHDKPYYMVVSLINPHDICYMAIRHFATTSEEKAIMEHGSVECATLDKALQKPEGVSDEEFFAKYCPTLPANFEPQEGEPKAIRSLLMRRPFRENARDKFSENDWRMHRWAYCRLTELVDKEIQAILDAIKDSGQENNTLIIFSSDHGDMNAAHRMEHKTALYEEAANIPFLVMWKGHIPGGIVDSTHLVSTGLDLLPTVCDFAGIKGIADPRGRSLRPLFEGKENVWRETLGVESEIGRMVISKDKLKFIKYDAVGIEEQLLDLSRDPYEKTQFTNNPEYQEKFAELRRAFETEWFPGY
jgi:arylsulfatase A-like enzyme